MAVKLRMKRLGAKKSPFYRIVAADSRAPRDGKDIETIGTYNPVAKGQQEELKVNEELALKWLANGAQPTGSVKNLFSKVGIMQKHHENKQSK